MLRNGAPSANVTHAMLAVARTLGHPGASASVTMDQLTLSEIDTEANRSLSISHSVGASGFNLAAISAVEAATKAVIRGDLGVEEGLDELDRIERTRLRHHALLQLVGWGVMAAGFAVLLGAGWFTVLLAGTVGLLIEAVSALLAKVEMPAPFIHVVSGAMATGAAILAVATTPGQSAAVIVTAALVSKLAGGSALGAAQDILTGWYLTASARVIEAMLVTGGLVVGIIGTLALASRFGDAMTLGGDPHVSSGLLPLIGGSVLVAGGFAAASQAPWSRIPVICVLAAGSNVIAQGVRSLGFSEITSVVVAASVLGAVAVLGTRWIKLPPSGVLGVALAPLLPGMQIYLGFVALTDGAQAVPHFALAALLAMALGSGIVLGEYVSSQVLWRGMQVRNAAQQRMSGEDALEARELTAEWLSTPLFRRPFLVEEFQRPDDDQLGREPERVSSTS